MKSEPQSDTLIEFGRFGFDKALGKLSKQGATIRLRGLPLKILQRLLERPGENRQPRGVAAPAMERHRVRRFRAGSQLRG